MTRGYCTCNVAGLLIGIPVDRVQEVLGRQTVTPVPLADPSVAGLFNLRSRIVTAIDARCRFDLTTPSADQGARCIVVAAEDELVGLLVDSVGDVVDLDDAELQEVPPTVQADLRHLLSGAYHIDGTLLLVLDTDRATSVRAR